MMLMVTSSSTCSFDILLRHRNTSMGSQWPSDRDMKVIVKGANGLFIYAATIYRFIAQPGWLSLDEPLHTVLAIMSATDKKSLPPDSTPISPFAELNAFYLLIMQQIPEQMLPSACLLLGCLCLSFFPSKVLLLTNLLRLSKVEIHSLCDRLNAVLKHHEGQLLEDHFHYR